MATIKPILNLKLDQSKHLYFEISHLKFLINTGQEDLFGADKPNKVPAALDLLLIEGTGQTRSNRVSDLGSSRQDKNFIPLFEAVKQLSTV